MNPLRRRREAGQSVWLDFLRRGLITRRGLQRLVEGDSLAGVTRATLEGVMEVERCRSG